MKQLKREDVCVEIIEAVLSIRVVTRAQGKFIANGDWSRFLGCVFTSLEKVEDELHIVINLLANAAKDHNTSLEMQREVRKLLFKIAGEIPEDSLKILTMDIEPIIKKALEATAPKVPEGPPGPGYG